MRDRFTHHAYVRYWQRRLAPLGIGPMGQVVERTAAASRRLGVTITREEAESRIGGFIYPSYTHTYFISDGTGPGVWLARLSRSRELILTYLAPRRPATPAENLRLLESILPGRMAAVWRRHMPRHRQAWDAWDAWDPWEDREMGYGFPAAAVAAGLHWRIPAR